MVTKAERSISPMLKGRTTGVNRKLTSRRSPRKQISRNQMNENLEIKRKN